MYHNCSLLEDVKIRTNKATNNVALISALLDNDVESYALCIVQPHRYISIVDASIDSVLWSYFKTALL